MIDKLIRISSILQADTSPRRLLIGFDGFIDEIIHVVATRQDAYNFIRIPTISAFAERIQKAAGFSANLELVPQQIKIGGNGVIMAACLAECGMGVDYIGALGYPQLDPLFDDFRSICNSVISVADAGYTQALEFDDGKLMLGKIAPMYRVTWENILATAGEDLLQNKIREASLIAFTNWTMLEGMNRIMTQFLHILQEVDHHPLIFIDLADPAKRSQNDVSEVLEIICQLDKYTEVILGLNEKESRLIAQYLNIPTCSTSDRATLIREKLALSNVVIHPLEGAAAATASDTFWVDGPYTPAPVLTTGAGDNFNAGFCLGRMLGMNTADSLLTGVYTSGYYVRFAHSPNRKQLIEWLQIVMS